MKELKPIHNELEYELALNEAALYFDKEPTPGTKAADRFEVLLLLIESYEAKHYVVSPADLIKAREQRFAQRRMPK